MLFRSLSKFNQREDAAVSLMEKPRDIVGGLVVMTIGTGFLMFGRELEMGTSFRMGPGYFPTTLRTSAVVGHDRVNVDRQPDAGAAQPAADRAVGADADDPVPQYSSRTRSASACWWLPRHS
jgi:hypothetical protein